MSRVQLDRHSHSGQHSAILHFKSDTLQWPCVWLLKNTDLLSIVMRELLTDLYLSLNTAYNLGQ